MSKSVSGPGIASPYVWSYSYALSVGNFLPPGQGCAGPCPTTKAIAVTAPDGSYSINTYGIEWEKNDGQLLSVATYSPCLVEDQCVVGQTNVLRSNTAYTYVTDAEVAGEPFLGAIGATPQTYMSDSWRGTQVRPQRKRIITQDGVNFSWAVSIGGFDTYARPSTVVKSASTGSSKTEVTTYENNTDNWVVGQVKTVTVGGVEASRTDYNTDARPSSVWQFGKKQYDLTYHASGASKGNVWQVTDGNARTTTYTDYYRGTARRVDFADGQFQTATVNALGLITAITNEAGFTTGYSYYTHGRLQTITYPLADSVAWNAKNFVFERVNAAEYGIALGHWRQTVSQGNARNVNYYDALWRPVATRTYDTGNVASTERMLLSRFDYTGKTAFTSYPRRTICQAGTTISNCVIDSSVVGLQSSYDALGRLTGTQADSELGTLTSSVQYLPGFQKVVTNPRGFATTTTFQVFDEPSESAPLTITEPEGVYTTITRDVFGLPGTMVRSGFYQGSYLSATRRYVYDAYKRLCKSIEPESGATVVAYDNASNVVWRAAGQNLTNPFACDDQSVAANQKTSYTYDARNRVTTTNYGDASPSISTTYTADGLPWTVSSDGSTWTYGYNKRRLLESENLNLSGYSYSLGHNYTANGHEGSTTYPNGSIINYFVNALGEQTRVGSYAYNVTRHPNGAVANFTYGNGLVHTGTQTIRNLPDLSADASYNGTVINDDYDWDENGNVSAIISGAGVQTSRSMQYDARDRLTQTVYDKIAVPVTFSYDALDNLRTYVTPERNFTHEYDANTWRLTRIRDQFNTTTYQYSYAGDAGNRGNVTTRFQANLPANIVYNFTFDQGNRMRALAGTAAQTYTYDGMGRRTRLTTNASTYRHQVYSQSGKLVYERMFSPKLKNGQNETSYAYLDNHLVGRMEGPVGGTATKTYVHTDGLGSPVAETNEAGVENPNARSLYEPYGLWARGPTSQGIGYTGHVRDAATTLIYMQQRYYDPIAGRFLSVDPVSADPNSGGNFNRYWYANNNPYKFIDPDGRDVVFGVDQEAASGNGHTTLYFQDDKGNWSAYNQGAAGGEASSGEGGVFNQRAEVSLERISSKEIPTDGVRIQTSSKQDSLISDSAEKSAESHNSGKSDYNLFSNNCTDAAVDVVNKSGAGIEVPNSAFTVKPNSWISEVKNDPGSIKNVEPKE